MKVEGPVKPKSLDLDTTVKPGNKEFYFILLTFTILLKLTNHYQQIMFIYSVYCYTKKNLHPGLNQAKDPDPGFQL